MSQEAGTFRGKTAGEVLMVLCPSCGSEFVASSRTLGQWDGETYRFECCGARHHLVAKGGAKNWLAPDPVARPAGVEGAA